MPRGDRTGPQGMGPMTGRAAGYCAGFQTPGFMNPSPRAGLAIRKGYNRIPNYPTRNPFFRTGRIFRGSFKRGRGAGRGFGNHGRGRGYGRSKVPIPSAYQPPTSYSYAGPIKNLTPSVKTNYNIW